MAERPEIPWADVGEREPLEYEDPGMVVDLRRCIGCHACSVACKTEHGVPLGKFRMRVRWLSRPDRPTLAFVPLFDEGSCDFCANRATFGLEPACVSSCPTSTLVFGDMADPASKVSSEAERHDAKPFEAREAKLKKGVLYIGHEPWQEERVHQGCPLDPRDEDIIYEQR